jgi:2-polyprenyl-6-methoxyphenol hydroxylase-like FAD-dependent oxidoreductase
MAGQSEIVIVGGGVAGSALAIVLARQGISVTVLERDPQYVDRVRGEFMAPWGVAEAKRLDLLGILLAAGGRHTRLHVPYDETMPPERALRAAVDVTKIHPEVPGPLCLSHPIMCAALSAAASAAGATVLRGIRDIEAAAGDPPTVAFTLDGERIVRQPGLLVGADGRNSIVQRQLGFTVERDEPHNLLGGMLVDGVPDWPQDIEALGTEGDIHYLVFPQGGEKLRLYLCYDFAQRARFAGTGRERNLLAAFRLKCLPHGESIAGATPIGPFHSFSNEDHWIEDPTQPGTVLVGDAAGHNDPIIGQGLSIALRDVRMVSSLVLAGDWRQAAFRPYVEERAERMRRLRATGRLAAKLRAEFGPDAAARRALASRRAFVDGQLSPLLASLAGPETLPPLAFEPGTIDALLAPG